MQLPASLAHISAEQDWQHTTPYPPLGFTPFYEGALGNGDTFGLYWPIGREAAEPIVVETWHDEWRIQPHFSSRTAFLQAYATAEDEYVALAGRRPRLATRSSRPLSLRGKSPSARGYEGQPGPGNDAS
jgi:hypothetical protein